MFSRNGLDLDFIFTEKMFLVVCLTNTDEFLTYLGKLRQLCEELQCPNICFVGDFNAGSTNTFGGLLEDFVWKLILSFLIMQYYPRIHSHTLVMLTTQLLG